MFVNLTLERRLLLPIALLFLKKWISWKKLRQRFQLVVNNLNFSCLSYPVLDKFKELVMQGLQDFFVSGDDGELMRLLKVVPDNVSLLLT